MEDYKIAIIKNTAENAMKMGELALKRCEEITVDLRELIMVDIAAARNTANITEKLILCKHTIDALSHDLMIAMFAPNGGCKVCANRDAECVPDSGNCHPVWRGICKENCEELEENKLRNDSL